MSGEELEGDGASELGVFGFVDDTHAAFPDFFEDFVVADVAAGHLGALPIMPEQSISVRSTESYWHIRQRP